MVSKNKNPILAAKSEVIKMLGRRSLQKKEGYSYILSLCILMCTIVFAACQQKSDGKNGGGSTINDSAYYNKQLTQILSMDTMSADQKSAMIDSQIEILGSDTQHQAYMNVYKALKFEREGEPDSASAAYSAIVPKKNDPELKQLKSYYLLDRLTQSAATVAAELMEQVMAETEAAEKAKSRVAYKYFDLLARANYQNRNEKKSLEYAELYYQNHPFKNHPKVMQRYYDISFLLAARLSDVKKMSFFNQQARKLAEALDDSTAIGRSYDNEAQVYAQQGEFKKALETSKAYFKYLKSKNSLNIVAYNNLGKSFYLNGQGDSAIYYYTAGNRLMEQQDLSKKMPYCYDGLKMAYTSNGNYAKALEAADSGNIIRLRNIQSIEESKLAEIHEKYQTEKKDLYISELTSNNHLKEKIIFQQRWIFAALILIVLGALSFLFIFQRQRLLRSKNRLLLAENSRLGTEQKMLQLQLNPHFIFNAMANLQSLIGSGERTLSLNYLSSFSKLLRNVLEQSRVEYITLEEEMETLKNYMELQKMRFNDAFDYEFMVDENMHPENLLIPPMLLQPFLENAVEHGFRNIEYKGMLRTRFRAEEGGLCIEIEDNGSGIGEKDASKVKKQSLSGLIIEERLKSLFEKKENASLTIQDKKIKGNTGLLVKLQMPIIKADK